MAALSLPSPPAALGSHPGLHLSFFSHCLSHSQPLGLSRPRHHSTAPACCPLPPPTAAMLRVATMLWGLESCPLSGCYEGRGKSPAVPWLFHIYWKHALPSPFARYFMINRKLFWPPSLSCELGPSLSPPWQFYPLLLPVPLYRFALPVFLSALLMPSCV